MRSNLVGWFLARANRAGLAIALPAAVLASSANAGVLPIQSDSAASTSNLGTFTGSLNYAFNMGLNAWTVTITLTNTSPAGNGGAITAFLFNIDSTDPNADATLASSTNGNLGNLTNGNGQPFGNMYDAGAGIANFNSNGGNPNNGITVGQSATLVFTVSATDAASLTEEDFINGPYQFDFIVRFRGFNGGGDDRVPASVVPSPTVLTAMAFGLILSRRRRRASLAG